MCLCFGRENIAGYNCIFPRTTNHSNQDISVNFIDQVQLYSSPSLKGHSREDTPLERTQFLGSKYSEYMWCSPLIKDTSLIRTELFGRKGVLLRGRLICWNVASPSWNVWPFRTVDLSWQSSLMTGFTAYWLKIPFPYFELQGYLVQNWWWSTPQQWALPSFTSIPMLRLVSHYLCEENWPKNRQFHLIIWRVSWNYMYMYPARSVAQVENEKCTFL